MESGGNSIPGNLLYSSEHEWLLLEGGTARVGISDYAQDQLGDVVFVDLPKLETQVDFMAKFGEIESVKVASELFSPASGEVIEVNAALEQQPELVNQDPYGAGWLIVLRLGDASELDKLLSPADYQALISKERGEA